MVTVKLLKTGTVCEITPDELVRWQEMRIPMEIVNIEKPEIPEVLKEKKAKEPTEKIL